MKKFLLTSISIISLLLIGHISLSVIGWIAAGSYYQFYGSNSIFHYLYIVTGPLLWLLLAILIAIAIIRIQSKHWFKWVLLVLPMSILFIGVLYTAFEVVKSVIKYKSFTVNEVVYECQNFHGAKIYSVHFNAPDSVPSYAIVKKNILFMKVEQFISLQELQAYSFVDDLSATRGVRTEDGLVFAPVGNPLPMLDTHKAVNNYGIEDAWKSLEKGIQSGDHARDESGGYQDLGQRLFTLISFSRIQTLYGGKIFVKGPHSDSTLNLSSKNDFGHYNPEFVKWMTNAFIPAEHNSAFRDATQSIFNRYLRPLARGFYITYYKLNKDPACFEKEKEEYFSKIKNNTLTTNSVDNQKYIGFLKKEFCGDSTDYSYLDIGLHDEIYASIVSFWFRRSIDGTINEFANGLSRLLKTYDEDFMTGIGQNSAEPTASPEGEKPADNHDMTQE